MTQRFQRVDRHGGRGNAASAAGGGFETRKAHHHDPAATRENERSDMPRGTALRSAVIARASRLQKLLTPPGSAGVFHARAAHLREHRIVCKIGAGCLWRELAR
jgi:hypothetical protein